MTLNELDKNRVVLIDALLPDDKDYIRKIWYSKEKRVIYYYIKFYPNLGSTNN